MQDEVVCKIKQVISDVLDIPVNEIGDDIPFCELRNHDSLNQLSIMLAIEYEFKLDLLVEQMADIYYTANTLKSVVEDSSAYEHRVR